jgi:valyl-tRNA synthetase
MNAEEIKIDKNLIDKHKDFVDDWIDSKFQNTLNQLNNSLDKFEINNASKLIYSYVWNDFCDWYVELTKNRIYSSDSDEVKSAVLTRAIYHFENMLKIVHPFMPFITEELWSKLSERKEGESISVSEFPKFEANKIDNSAEDKMHFLQNIVSGIRNIRGEMNIPPSKKISTILKTASLEAVQISYIKSLVKIDDLKYGEEVEKPSASASAVLKDCEIFVPLEGIIDLGIERERLNKEITRLKGALIGVDKKLSNERFVNNAPAEVVEKEKSKKADWENSIEKLSKLLNDIS